MRCDCGHRFDTSVEAVAENHRLKGEWQRVLGDVGRLRMLGGGMLLVGVSLSVASYLGAVAGGTRYIVFTGICVVGLRFLLLGKK